MNLFRISATLSFMLLINMTYSQDSLGCKDHPLLKSRLPHFFLTECVINCDSTVFNFLSDDTIQVTRQGKKTFLRYDFNFESLEQKPECIQILQFYENESKLSGTPLVYQDSKETIRIIKLEKEKEIVWIKIECGGDDHNDYYFLTIVEPTEQLRN